MSRGFFAPKISIRWSAFVASLALFSSFFIFIDSPPPSQAAPGLDSTGLTVNLDATNTSSLSSSSATQWTSVSPGSYTGSGNLGTVTRNTVGSVVATSFTGSNAVGMGAGVGRAGGDMTVETWVQATSIKAGWNIIATRWFDSAWGQPAGTADWHFGFYDYGNGSTAKLNLYTTGTSDKNGTTSIIPNKWYLIGFTISGSTGQLYLNGQPEGPSFAVSRTDQPNANLWLGDARSAIGMTGYMSKFRIYTSALTSAKMRSNFQSDGTAYGYPVITFKPNGATSTSVDSYQDVVSNASTALTANAFTRSNFTFTGWNTAADGSGTSYANSQLVSLTSELTLYAQWTLNAPTVTTAPTVSGTPQVGQTLTASNGSYVSGTTPSLAWQWQNSADNSEWNDIAGAVSSTYTLANSDGAMYVRAKQTATNATASVSATSTATALVISAGNVAATQGANGNVGSMFTVPSGSTFYNVTLVSSNLSGAFSLGTTTGLTWVEGYSSTASYMPSSIGGTGSIFSFRGTGDAINSALATLKYTSSSVQTDVLRIYSAVGSATATDVKNYIPIFDNGRLTYHYYGSYQGASANQSTWDTSLAGSSTLSTQNGGSLTSSNPWYLVTPRYAVEHSRVQSVMAYMSSNGWSTGYWATLGARADAGSSTWYWPAKDGYSSTQTVGTTFWNSGSPSASTTSVRAASYSYANSVWGWNDSATANSAIVAETYSTTPLSATTTAQTYRAVSAANAPTNLVATANSKFSVGLTWTAPSSLGTDSLTDYSIQYSTDQNTWTTWAHSAFTSASATVTGLTPGQAYWFRVAAVTSVTGAYSSSVSSAQADTGSTTMLTGYSVPSNTTGTVRVLLFSNNAQGMLSVTTASGLKGIRNTPNYSATPNAAELYFGGRMIGLVGSAADVNAALATLRYRSAAASNDTISMYISNGAEYIPIVRSGTLTFHYYGYNGTTAFANQSAAATSISSQNINGVAVTGAYLATPGTAAEQQFHTDNIATTYTGDSIWLGGTTNGTGWQWLSGTDMPNIVFSVGITGYGSYTNSTTGDVFPLRWNGGEPNGGVATGGNCIVLYGNASNARTSWDDQPCSTANRNAAWEYTASAPLGLGAGPTSANYAPAAVTQLITVVTQAAAPTSLTATSTTVGQVDLSWTAPASVSGITSYSVQYSTDANTWTDVRSTASTTTTQSITGLTTGANYQFRVAAIVPSGTGLYATTYFTPNGAGRILAVTGTAKSVNTLTLDTSLNSRKVRVLLRTNNAGSTVKVSSYTNITGIRGTSNYTATASNATLGTAGRMIGLVGTGSDVNAALATLQYTGPGSPTTDSISMWVSAGNSLVSPEEYVPVVNAQGQVDFHYFGYASSTLTWQGAVNAALVNTATINGQSAPGKFLATLESLDQNALAYSKSNNTSIWMNAADFTMVSPTNADGAWYWLGPDTGITQFYSGGTSAGVGGMVNTTFAPWGSSSSAQGEPNGTTGENCMSGSGASYALTTSGFTALSNVGGLGWNDNGCTSTTTGYVWEYVANEPVGASSIGDNYAGMQALAVIVNVNADAPTGLTALAAGNGSAVVSWTAPTVYSSNPITGYTVQYSTAADFSSGVTSVATGSANPYHVVTGLTANTTYYFRVFATGTGWSANGTTSAGVSVATKAAATTLTVVTTGGGTAGTDFTTANGLIAAVSDLAVSVNAADLESLLATSNVRLLADNVVLSGDTSWSANTTLQLGISSASRVSVNADLTGSGATAGIVMMPVACTYSATGTYNGCYSLDVKSGANITLSGATPSLSIGGTSYTVVNTVAGLISFAGVGANYSKPWALAAPLDLSSSPFTNALFGATYFSGTLDGLGNTVSNYTVTTNSSSNWEIGFFYVLSNATVRNFGLTTIKFLGNPTSGASYFAMGALGGYNIGTNSVDQVWSTGSIKTSASSVAVGVGGLLAWIPSGSTTLTRSWSSVSIDTTAATGTPTQMAGGLVGGTVSSMGQASSGAGSNLTINEAYYTGAINFSTDGWRGIGGILGIHYDTGTIKLTDVFSWGIIKSNSNSAGIAGVIENGSATITRAYTSSAACSANGAYAGCTANQKPGATLSGTAAAAWGSSTGSTLVNLASPAIPLYVKPYLRTGNAVFADGSYGAVGYKLYDGNNNEYTTLTGATGYPSVSGTATWDTITASSAVGTYSVKYASGLSLSGTAASSYSLNALSSTTSIQLTSTTIASAPTGLTLTGSGQTTAVVGWSAPASPGTGGVTNYRVWYSSSASLSGASYIDTNNARTWALLSGLTSNTTYYVKVQALGSAWVSDVSAIANGVTKNAATSLTVVSSGGGNAGTNFSSAGGAFAPAGANTSASINASDLQSALGLGDAILAADTVTISGVVTWAASTKLTIANASSSTVAVNADVTATGTSAGLDIKSSSYALDTKNGVNVVLSGASSTFSLGGNAFTLIRTVADLASAQSSWWYALANPITFSSAVSSSPVNLAYSGVFDGLGNTVNNMTITATTTGDYGFFRSLAGATVRNLGVTNVNLSSSTGSLDLRFGALAGDGSSSGTNTLSQVWATGFINQTATTGRVQAGGIVGGATAGTLNMSKTWSSVAVTTYAPSVGSGGIIGTNVSAWAGGSGSGNTLSISESYSTGNILRVSPSTISWYGNAGIIGVAYGVSTTLTNVFSWGNINSTGTYAGTSTAGISGVGTATITNAYTTHPTSCGGSSVTNCVYNVTAGNTVSGFSTGLWSTTNGASLANLPAPTKTLYVKVTAPTDGTYGTMGYLVVDSTGTTQTTTALASMNLAVSGNPTYTIDSSAPKATYNVNYVTGLVLAGTSSGVYSLSAWINTTSVTISRDVTTLSWTPTSSFIRTDSGATLAAPTTNSDATPTYSVSGVGNTASCSITSGRVLSFTATGNCTVTTTYAQTTLFTAATASVTITVADAPPASPTSLSVTAGAASGQLGVSWTAPSTTTTGGTIASYTVETSTDNSTWTVTQTGVVGTTATLTGLSNGTALYVRVKAVNTASVAGTYVTSAATTPYWKPVNSVVPSFTGSAVGGLPLTGSAGTWSDNGNSVTSSVYQWQLSTDSGSNYTDISGATSSNYTLLASQATNLVRLKVTKTNSAGSTIAYSTATSAVQSGLASAPTLGAVTRGNSKLTVNWTAPSTTNGGTISAYKVLYSTDANTWSTASNAVADTATSYVITGLTNGTGYYVRVLAITAAGDGAAATSSGTTIPATGPSNSGIPTVSGTVAVARALTSTDGSWADGGDSITYTYQWQSSATGLGSWSDIAGATSVSYTPVVGDVGNYLRLNVTATNTVSSATASTSSSTVVLSGLANAPTSIYTVARNQQLNFNWTAPLVLNGGVINDYIVEYKKSTDSTWNSVRVGSATNFLTINGLTNGAIYDGRITPVTAAGSGATGNLTSGVGSTPYNYPTISVAPTTGVPAVAVATTSTTGTWNENGRAVSSYTYQWESSINGSTGWTVIAGATAATYTPVSADAGKYLRVKVSATNLGGTSPAAYSVATAAVMTGLASAVTLSAADRGDTQLTVNWAAPSTTNGGVISAYKVYYSTDRSTWTAASSNVSASATSYTITGLTNGTAYYVQVIPVTAAGDGVAVASTGTTTPATGPSNSVAPSISGTAAAARVMSSTNGTWADGGDPITYSFQWQSSADGSTNWTDITGATSSTYTAAANLVGSYLRLNVTATNTVSALTVASSSSTIVQSGLAGAASALSSTASNGQLVLSWTAPANVNGGVISDYTVEYKASTDSTWTSTAVGSTATTKTITGLANAVSYDWRVTAVTAAGSGTTASFTAATSSTPFTTPTNSVLPTVAAPAVAVSTTSTDGTWSGNGRAVSGYSYQWELSANGTSGWAAISGATSASYTPVTADAGKYLRLQVTATNAAGTSTIASAASTSVATGLASAPQTLAAGRGNSSLAVTWTAPSAFNGGTISAYKIQYSTDGSAWTTASSAVASSSTSYTITGLTNGTAYYVRAIAVTAAGDGAVATTSSTTTPSTTATNTAAPVISGTSAVTRVLSVSTGTWNNGGDTATYTYQWQSSATLGGTYTNISGATSSSYTPVTADVGNYLKVVVTATNVAGSTTAVSSATGAVETALASAPTSISGAFSTVSGNHITVTWTAPSALNGASAITAYELSYATSAGGSYTVASSSISPGTTSYDVTGLTLGTNYFFKVAAKTAAGTGALSSASSSVPNGAAPLNSAVPTLTGTVAVGRVLTSANGAWDEYGFTSSYTYQWQSASTSGGSYANIAGATSPSYTPVLLDAGRYLKLAVTATNAVGASSSRTAASVAVASGLTSAPASVIATRADAGLAVSWTAPATLNGGVISGYTVKYSTDNFNWSTASSTVAAGATGYSVTGLTNGTAYYVQVFAETAAGLSPAGSISGTATPSTTATNTVVPAITGTVAVTRQLSVSDGTWTTGGAAVIYSYQWQSSANGSTDWASISGATSATYTPDATQAGKYLRAVVTATNAAGAVSASTAATTVVQTGLADAPASVSAAFSDANGLHIDVSWTDPASLNGASAISAYVLSYSTTANGTYTVVSSSLPGNSSTYAVTGLTQGQTYFFRVSATTAAGVGVSLTTSSSTLFGGPPTISTSPAITGTQAVGYALTADHGAWNNNGLAISGYTYQWQISSDNSAWSNIAGATSSNYTPVTADAGNYLRSVVSATNSVGTTSAPSSGTLIGTGISDAPATVSVTPGDNQLSVTWAAVTGSALRNAVRGGYRVQWSTDGTTWQSQVVGASVTSYVIPSLTNAQPYSVRVAAIADVTNVVGADAPATGTFIPFGLPITNTVPILSGAQARGYQLSATDGIWDSNGRNITSTTYQWQRSTDSAATWTNISSATTATYTLAATDIGNLVRIKVTKTNVAGTTTTYSVATSAVESAVAAAPTTISVTAGDRQLAVQWVAPTSLAGGTIADYLVEYSSNGGSSWTAVSRSASTATSQSITGLVNGTGYLVRVSALTSVQGTSATASAAVVPFYTPINTVVPAVTAAPRLLDSLTASVGTWNENGSAITQTDLQWQVSHDSGSTWVDIAGATSASYVSVDELGKPLRVKVTQHNGGGATIVYSAASAPIVIGTPDAPTGLSVSPGDLSLTLDWTAPTVLAGGAINDYTVQYSTNGGTSWTTMSRSASTAASQTLSGLTLGQAYLVRVRTETGESSAWATATSFTAVGKPAVSTTPTISGTPLAGQTLNVGTGTWNANGAAVSGYSFEWQQSTDNGSTWTNVLGGTSTSIPAVSGRIYRVNITATNAAGSTQTTTQNTPAVASTRATVPQQLTLVEQDQQITVSWATPLGLGGVPLSNYEVDYSSDGGNNWNAVTRTNNTTTSQVITGLTNNVDYDVRVRAVTTVTGQYAISSSSARPHGAPINIGGLSLISGTSSFNQRLTAANGTWDWNGSSQSTFTYQWMHSADGGSTWSAINGETASTYSISGYVGEKIRVALTATNAHNEATTIYSNATATVAPIASTGPLAVSATPHDQSVAVSWAAPQNTGGTSVVRYDVEFSTDSSTWIRVTRGNGAALSESIGSLANGVTYYVRSRAVTAVDGNWAYAAAVIPFGLPQSQAAPAVSGTLVYGQTLNANSGSWGDNGSSITALDYQWQYNDGATWQNIPGATAYGYNIGLYVGKTLRVAVTATNAAGTSTSYSSASSTVIAAPAGQVPTLSVTPADQSLEVAWSAPNYTGGSAITDYQLEYSVDGSSWTNVAHTASTQTSRTITGLNNGQTYQVRVRALNGVSGTARVDSSGVIPRGTPINTVAPALSGTAQVNQMLVTNAGTWNVNGSELNATAYQWQVFDGSSWSNISGATASYYTLTGYVGKTLRSVVTATNAAGQTSARSSASVTVLPAGSSAPRILTATEQDQQVVLNWIAPATTGGANVIDYEVQSSPDGNTWTTLSRSASTQPTHTISGLTNGDAVYFRVRALNGVNGSWAFLSQPATPRGLPINLDLPEVTGTESYGSVLSTTDGDWDSNGAAITSTTYQWQSSLNGTTWTNIIGATNRTYTVGLFVGSQIRVRVVQTNPAGSTTEYSLPSGTILSSTPAAPRIISQQAGNASVGVGWSVPDHIGGGILQGYSVEYSVDQSVWASRSVGPDIRSIALDGLTNGATYFVRVRAETNLNGSWSGISNPLTPRAPVVPVVVTPTASPTNFEAIRQTVMPVTLAPAASLRTSSGSSVSVTQDGRIELPPTESIALLNGASVPASVVAQGEQLLVSMSAVQMQVTFDGNFAGESNPNDQLSFAGTGFAPGTPLVTWIQSTPRKVAEGTAAKDGTAEMDFMIPSDIGLGHHTLQINGVSATGEVLSVAYGIDVVAHSENSVPFPTGMFVPWWAIILALLLLIAGAVGTVRNVRRRQM